MRGDGVAQRMGKNECRMAVMLVSVAPTPWVQL